MNTTSMKASFTILVATIAGFIGGTLGANHQVTASAVNVMRASRFELVDSSGVTVAHLRVDANREVSLSFIDNKKIKRFELGIHSSGHPFLAMQGSDSRRRLVMDLDQEDKPTFGMGDDHWEGKVMLGFLAPDQSPYGRWDRWGLLFRPTGSDRAVVGLGMSDSNGPSVKTFGTVGDSQPGKSR